MFYTPYETTVLSNYNITPIRNSLESLIVSRRNVFSTPSELGFNTDSDKEYLLFLVNSEETGDIPSFTQPLLINIDPVTNNSENERFVIDIRNISRVGKTGEYTVSKYPLFRIQSVIGILTGIWKDGGVHYFTNSNKVTTKVFSNWLGSALARRMNLETIAQVRTNVIIAYYFLCLFKDYKPYAHGETLNEDDLYITAVKIGHATGLKVQDAMNIIRDIPTMTSVNDLCSALKEHGDSDRFKVLNSALIYQLVMRSAFFGVSNETIMAAIEYPPIFTALVFIAVNDRGYNKSDIGGIVHNLKATADVKHFGTTVSNMVLNG